MLAILEAQQRYFSYRAILVAIVSRNSSVLVFMVYRTSIARYVTKRGIAQMYLWESKYETGGIAPFWGKANVPENVSRDMGYHSDSIAISRDMGPLSWQFSISFADVFLVFEAFQTRVAHFCLCCVRLKMPLLICFSFPHSKAWSPPTPDTLKHK